jgi:N-acetylglucosaminyl-diphospho-decaprenol L-rhamnosyltransferase
VTPSARLSRYSTVESDVAVVIGNYQGASVLDDCLDSLALQTQSLREIIVADGASTDRSREIAERHGARFLTFPNDGLGVLYNRGVQATEATYVLLLNNDVALDARCVELLAAELRADESRFAADPTQLDWSGRVVIHARATLRAGALVHEMYPGLHLDQLGAAVTVVPTVFANGAAMLVRRQMFAELGGFDETFFMDCEDLDLCWRAWHRGWSCVYVPGASLRHRLGAATSSAIMPRRSASAHHNLMRFALKCLPLSSASRVLLGELLRLPRHPRAIGSGLAALSTELAETRRLRSQLRPHRPTFERLLAL